MRVDPEYGRSSFGYASRKCVELCFVTRNQLDNLSDDFGTQSWKEHPEFSDYREAIQGISELGEVNK